MRYLLLLLIFAFLPQQAISYAENTYYGQIINPDTYLYRDLKSNVIFELPVTYYVKLSGYEKGHYIAEYQGIKGYVEASKIKVVSGSPKSPYLTGATFKLFASDYNKLKSTPNVLSQDLAILPINEKIDYIATTYAKELINGRGSAWYYCSYKVGEKMVRGYVYAGLCQGLHLPPNTENLPYINNPYISPSSEYKEYLENEGKSLVFAPVLLISLLFIPLLFVPLVVKRYKKPKKLILEDGKI